MLIEPIRHSRRVLALAIAALVAFVVFATAQAAVQVGLWPASGWNTLSAYPSSTVGCPSPGIVWQHSVATHLYDDRVSNPKQLWIDYYDVYSGTPTDKSYIWNYIFINDGVNSANSGYYSAPAAWAFWRDWTIWPQRSFGYSPTGNQVSVATHFNVYNGTNCGDYSVIVFRH